MNFATSSWYFSCSEPPCAGTASSGGSEARGDGHPSYCPYIVLSIDGYTTEAKQGREAVDLALVRCELVRDEVEKRQRAEWQAPTWAAEWTATWAASDGAGTGGVCSSGRGTSQRAWI